MEANDRRSALLQIERMGYIPVSVLEGGVLLGTNETKKKKKKTFSVHMLSSRRPRMKLHEVLLLTGELSDLLASGMTLGKALHTLSRRETGTAQDQIITELRAEIIQGASMSDALGKWPETFSPLYVSMVRAGEASGALADALQRLRTHYERYQAAREKVLMALVYPSIILSVGAATMVFIMIFVVPRFTAMFEELGSTLPLPTRMLMSMSDGLQKYWWVIIGVIALLTFLFRRSVQTQRGRLNWHKIQLRLPIVHLIIKANAFAHFARTLGALLANGVPVLQALSIVEDTVGNVVIAGEIRQARDRVTDGSTISGPLGEGNIFPPLLTDMLAVGEETGDMCSALVHIAKRYDDELDRTVKILTTVLEPILMLTMAVLVGFVAVSILLAVFDLTSGLNV